MLEFVTINDLRPWMLTYAHNAWRQVLSSDSCHAAMEDNGSKIKEMQRKWDLNEIS